MSSLLLGGGDEDVAGQESSSSSGAAARLKAAVSAVGSSVSGLAGNASERVARLWRPGDALSEEDEDTNELQRMAGQVSEYFKLTWEQRLTGFGVCVGGAVVCSLVSWLFLFSPVAFAMLYSAGNIFGIVGSLFLLGPVGQAKRMFAKRRWIAATVFLASIVATIFFALRGVHILVFVFMTVQWLALVWYCLSYIPGAQTLCWTTVSACLGL